MQVRYQAALRPVRDASGRCIARKNAIIAELFAGLKGAMQAGRIFFCVTGVIAAFVAHHASIHTEFSRVQDDLFPLPSTVMVIPNVEFEGAHDNGILPTSCPSWLGDKPCRKP